MSGKDQFSIFVLSILGMMLSGVVFQDMFEWFVTGAFGVTPVTYVQSLGLLLFLSFFRNLNISKEKKKFKDALNDLIYVFSYTLSLWGFSFIVSLFL